MTDNVTELRPDQPRPQPGIRAAPPFWTFTAGWCFGVLVGLYILIGRVVGATWPFWLMLAFMNLVK